MWRWCAIQQSYVSYGAQYKVQNTLTGCSHSNQNTVPKRIGTDCNWKLLFWLCEGQNVQTHCNQSLWPQFQLPKARHCHLNHSNNSKNISWEPNYNARKLHCNQYRFLQASLELFTHVSLEVEDRVLALRYALYRIEENAKNVAFSILLGVMNSMSNHRTMVIANPAVWRVV
jgi:hypothetical protein